MLGCSGSRGWVLFCSAWSLSILGTSIYTQSLGITSSQTCRREKENLECHWVLPSRKQLQGSWGRRAFAATSGFRFGPALEVSPTMRTACQDHPAPAPFKSIGHIVCPFGFDRHVVIRSWTAHYLFMYLLSKGLLLLWPVLLGPQTMGLTINSQTTFKWILL